MTDDIIIINGSDTREIGVIVTSLPPIQMPQERVNEILVPGRSGFLTISDDSYEPIIKTCGFFYEGDNPEEVARYLQKAITFTFSNEPDKVYTGRFVGPANVLQTIFTWHEFSVNFLCYPEKREVNPQEIAANSGIFLTNPGNRKAWPTFEITGSGTIVLTVGTQTVTLTAVDGTIILDGELQECYTSAEVSANLQMTGYFPVIEAEEALEISWTGTVTEVIIFPNWRWV
jgi:phage-related protein